MRARRTRCRDKPHLWQLARRIIAAVIKVGAGQVLAGIIGAPCAIAAVVEGAHRQVQRRLGRGALARRRERHGRMVSMISALSMPSESTDVMPRFACFRTGAG